MKIPSQVYGFYAGTVSKVTYPISIAGSISADVLSKALAINFMLSIPFRATHAYNQKSFIKKAVTLLNINTEFDLLKKASLFMATGSTLFSDNPEGVKGIWRKAVADAKHAELVIEKTLCFNEILCSGDQYGAFDLISDKLA